jgi:PAS domain S-box-containing protein
LHAWGSKPPEEERSCPLIARFAGDTRTSRLALRFALIALLPFVVIGVALHVLIAPELTPTGEFRADLALFGGLLLLYVLTLPLAFRAGRTLKTQASTLAEEAQERRRAEEELERIRTIQGLLLESAGEGIIGVGVRGNAIFVNPAAASMVGWEPHELLGRSIHDAIHHSRADGSPYPEEDCPISASFRDGRVYQIEGEVFWRRDGTSFPVEYAVAPLEQNGDRIGIVLMFRDVTERWQADEALRRNFQLLRKSHEERRRLVAQLVKAEEEERRRIAGEIHDDSLQVMAAVAMYLHTIRRHVADPEGSQTLDALDETVHEAIVRLRHLLFDLRPPTLDLEGLPTAIEMCLEETLVPLGVAFSMEERLTSEPGSEARTILYRIAQEALTNVAKHAEANKVSVSVEQRDEGFLVRIEDDGQGFSLHEALRPRPGQLGLGAMKERAEIAGGWFRVDSAPGTGTTVEFWVPDQEPVEIAL